MKKRPEDDLLNDVFSKSGGDFRAASLEQTLFAVRQQRRQRIVFRAGGVVALCVGVLAVGLIIRTEPDRSVSPVAEFYAPTADEAKPSVVPGTNIRLVNDEELLAMFANRPVALMGPLDDRQFIVLDEIRKEPPAVL